MGRESGVLQGRYCGFLVAVRADSWEYGRESLVDSWSQYESTGRNTVGKASWILGRCRSRKVKIENYRKKKVSKSLQYKK